MRLGLEGVDVADRIKPGGRSFLAVAADDGHAGGRRIGAAELAVVAAIGGRQRKPCGFGRQRAALKGECRGKRRAHIGETSSRPCVAGAGSKASGSGAARQSPARPQQRLLARRHREQLFAPASDRHSQTVRWTRSCNSSGSTLPRGEWRNVRALISPGCGSVVRTRTGTDDSDLPVSLFHAIATAGRQSILNPNTVHLGLVNHNFASCSLWSRRQANGTYRCDPSRWQPDHRSHQPWCDRQNLPGGQGSLDSRRRPGRPVSVSAICRRMLWSTT